MSEYLCISATFLDRRFHGRADGGKSEWPPSPLRLFQAIVAANGEAMSNGGEVANALRWLERQPPPVILAPRSESGAPLCLSVPNNAMDIVGRAWSKGNYFSTGKNDANPATHRTMKTIKPVHMIEGDTIRYLWSLSDSKLEGDGLIETLIKAAGRMFALGWGIDMVVGHGEHLASVPSDVMTDECWKPSNVATHNALRIPITGTLNALRNRYGSFLKRVTTSGFSPVDPLSQFDIIDYRRSTDPQNRPSAVFELRQDDGSFFRHPQRKLKQIAGMIRHLAIEAMKNAPPPNLADSSQWIDRYVAGHSRDYPGKHQQFSYLPLPSIGMQHTDPSIRRVMIAAPIGDDRFLDHLALRLAGEQLKPKRGDEFGEQTRPTLVRVRRDTLYTAPANNWASVTPVILPGHNDHKPAKTVKLIEKALQQSGVEQPCTFEWRATSWWPKSLSAHKYDRNKKPTGYSRPDHLLSQTAVHLKLRFDNALKFPGPLVIGAGRHCGFGLMAGFDHFD